MDVKVRPQETENVVKDLMVKHNVLLWENLHDEKMLKLTFKKIYLVKEKLEV